MTKRTPLTAQALLNANTALIRHTRFNELHQDIELCRHLSQLADEAQCMSLEGRPGTGKTTLVKNYAHTFQRDETCTTTRIPVFYMETPSPVTVKGMAARMLEVIGDPAAHRGPLWAMNSRLIDYLKLCQVQLVILDDFHHLIDKETDRILETVSDWLKVLIKETRVPFLVVGLEGRVELILKSNEQLSRLFAMRETFHPFVWEPSDVAATQAFASFMQVVETGIQLPLSDELPRAELLHRLHYATDGVVGYVMNLIRFAVWLADRQQTDVLNLAVLSQAFAKRLQPHLPHKANPFGVAVDQHFVAPSAIPTDAPHSTNRRSKRRKVRKPTAAAVLKTG
ncbi:MAG: TniB family NTP-binding protein [Anaerolineaceae bacterium]|nr:TniB family NTP-binding protein [Anaerolineaceae bacterium]